MIFFFLINVSDNLTRKGASQFISTLSIMLMKYFDISFTDSVNYNPAEQEALAQTFVERRTVTMFKDPVNKLDQIQAETMMLFFFDKMIAIIPPANQGGTGYRKLDQFFNSLARCMNIYEPLRGHLLQKNILIMLFDFYMAHETARFTKHEKVMSPVLVCMSYLLNTVRQRMGAKEDNNISNYFNYFNQISFF